MKELPIWVSEQDSIVYLNLYIQPGAKKTQIAGVFDDKLKIRLMAPPVDGKANKALVDWLSGVTETSKRDIEIISGALSRHKRIRILNSKADFILDKLLKFS